MVYSARPKGRLWEADINGIVVSTLRLRELITAPSLPLLGYGYIIFEAGELYQDFNNVYTSAE